MRLDWARYSAEDRTTQGGHRWRAGSRKAVDCPPDLLRYTELPAYAEGQSGWRPYHTGRSSGGELALCYVEVNRSPGRSNRVNARVLFVPSSAASLWPALCTLQEPEHFTGTDAVVLPDEPGTPAPGSEDHQAAREVQLVLQAFALARKERVVLQSSDEPRFLSALWQQLWPAARYSLTFQRHFHPREITATTEQLQLILVPDATPWARDPRFLVAKYSAPKK